MSNHYYHIFSEQETFKINPLWYLEEQLAATIGDANNHLVHNGGQSAPKPCIPTYPEQQGWLANIATSGPGADLITRRLEEMRTTRELMTSVTYH